MITATQIKPKTPVVCSNDAQLAIVDQMEGPDSIRLAKDDKGQSHFIPLKWVTKVDDKIHLDRTGEQAMKGWSMTAPTASTNTSSKR
jgi:hypothetical protein